MQAQTAIYLVVPKASIDPLGCASSLEAPFLPMGEDNHSVGLLRSGLRHPMLRLTTVSGNYIICTKHQMFLIRGQDESRQWKPLKTIKTNENVFLASGYETVANITSEQDHYTYESNFDDGAMVLIANNFYTQTS